MALPSSGTISLDDVNAELGNAAGTQISLNDVDVRTLAGKSSGVVSMSDLYGKSAYWIRRIHYLATAYKGLGVDYDSAGNVYTVRRQDTSGHLIVTKTDFTGALLAEKQITHASLSFINEVDLAVSTDDAIYISGTLNSSPTRGILIKLTSTLAFTWDVDLTKTGEDVAVRQITRGSSGKIGCVGVTGSDGFFLEFNSNSTLNIDRLLYRSSHTVDLETVQLVGSNYLVGGNVWDGGSGVKQACIVYINSTGTPFEYFGVSDAADSRVVAIAHDSSSNSYSLVDSGANDYRLVKLNSAGTLQWTKKLQMFVASGIVSDGTDLYVSGYTIGANAYITLQKITSSGGLTWGRNILYTGNDLY